MLGHGAGEWGGPLEGGPGVIFHVKGAGTFGTLPLVILRTQLMIFLKFMIQVMFSGNGVAIFIDGNCNTFSSFSFLLCPTVRYLH